MSEPSVQKNRKFHSAVEVLRDKASALPAQMAYRITRFREAMDEIIDYGRLDLSARCIAGRLRAECPEIAGERVLICIGFGLEYITAFFGCLYAGAIAVPAFPPRQNRMGQRLRAIAADAEPKVVLTTSQLLETARAQLDVAPSPGLEWIAVDALQIGTADSWVEPRASPDDVAYLQYTSGSTAEPKGVMVTHRNILHNSRLLNELFRTTSESHAVSWLPLHHDMGLIGAIFQPLLGGYAATMMAPASFLQKPYRWLEAIGRYRCTISAAPNFAYDLCTRSIPPAQRDTLDLSSWKDACCGGEPVRPETLERFTDHFRPCGFRKGALFPCYGLAEATLIVAGGIPGDPARVGCFQTSSLKEHRAVPCAGEPAEGRALVSCGSALPEIDLKIVDPETRLPVAAGSVGEIWTASASVASGYWKRPAETEATFKARLRHDGDSVFLRTGDMGFIWEDGLYITGRRKELIIVHGANFYPQDIENTVASCHDALGAGAGAVFAIDDGREERLVVVHELGRNASTPGADAIFAKIRQAVWDEHELKLHAVALVKKFGVPRTSSGKIQRFVCRDNFLSQTLPVLAEWKAPAEAAPVSETGSRRNGVLTAAAIQNWLIVRTSELLNLKPFEVDTRVPFGQYGFDSIKAVSLSAELEDWIGLSLPSTLLWDYPNIDSLSNYLVSRAREVKERRLSASPNGAGPGQQYQ